MPYSNVTINRVDSNGANVIVAYEDFQNANSNTSSLSIAVDYANVLVRIATALENISANLNTLNNHVVNTNVLLSNTNVLLSNTNSILNVTSSAILNIDGYIQNIDDRGSDNTKGFLVKSIETPDENLTPAQQRAITISALKNAGTLDSVKEEIQNPTPL